MLHVDSSLTRRLATLLADDVSLVILQLCVRDLVEGVLGVRCLVDSGVVLESSLDDTLGGSSYQDHLVSCLTDVGILHTTHDSLTIQYKIFNIILSVF